MPLSVTDIRAIRDELIRFYMEPDGLNRRARGLPDPIVFHDRGIEEWDAVAVSDATVNGVAHGIETAKAQIKTFPEYKEQHPVEPLPPSTADMHRWPKFGASYQQALGNPACDPALLASLLSDAGCDFTRVWAMDAWAVGPNGDGQYSGFVPWLRDSAGVFDLDAPDGRYDQRVHDFVRTMNQRGITVQITTLELYSWSERKQGMLWVPDQHIGPVRHNRQGVQWGHPDDPTFFSLPDDTHRAFLARLCDAVRGLQVCFEIGNEMPEKEMHERIARELLSHFSSDWAPELTVNRNDDTPGQYANMRIGTNYDRIAYHGKDSLAYLDEHFPDEPDFQTFRQFYASGTCDPARIIMSTDGCRINNTIDCYDWETLGEVCCDHLDRGLNLEHQSRVKMRPFLEGRLDLVADFEGDWLRSLQG